MKTSIVMSTDVITVDDNGQRKDEGGEGKN